MCITSNLASTLAQPQALLLMTLVVQRPLQGYHHCLGTTPHTTRLKPWPPVSTRCIYTLVRLNQPTHQDPVRTANREEILLGPRQKLQPCSPKPPLSAETPEPHKGATQGGGHMPGGWDSTVWKLMGRLWVYLCHPGFHNTITILPPVALPGTFRSSASTHTLCRHYFLCGTGPWRFSGLGCDFCSHCVLSPPVHSPFHSSPHPKCLLHLMFVF
jgi:hypothetical protein